MGTEGSNSWKEVRIGTEDVICGGCCAPDEGRVGGFRCAAGGAVWRRSDSAIVEAACSSASLNGRASCGVALIRDG